MSFATLNATEDKSNINAEVVGFRDNKVLLMPLGEMSGVGPGNVVAATGSYLRLELAKDLIGRVIDGMGNPIDGKGRLNS